eukprot:scaffold159250_cov17-Tisochrysis_lutea.AAC.1
MSLTFDGLAWEAGVIACVEKAVVSLESCCSLGTSITVNALLIAFCKLKVQPLHKHGSKSSL